MSTPATLTKTSAVEGTLARQKICYTSAPTEQINAAVPAIIKGDVCSARVARTVRYPGGTNSKKFAAASNCSPSDQVKCKNGIQWILSLCGEPSNLDQGVVVAKITRANQPIQSIRLMVSGDVII